MLISRRGLLKYGALYGATIGLSSIIGVVISRQPSAFDIALKEFDPKKIQDYLDIIYATSPKPAGLKGINYIPSAERHPKGEYYEMSTYSNKGSWLEKADEIYVQVYPSAFFNLRSSAVTITHEDYISEQEFLSSLLGHEYRHVKQANGELTASIPSKVIDELRKNVELKPEFSEVDAYFDEIKNFENKNFREGVQIGQRYRSRAYSRYRSRRRAVQNVGVTPATLWILENYPELPERPRRVLPNGF